MLSCAENSGVLAVASNRSPSESLRAEMLYKCGNLMLGCWRHYWGLLETTGIDFKAVGNTQSQNEASCTGRQVNWSKDQDGADDWS
ncbi:hypothetical protein QL285_045965 [Trifolium repens]|nr:hypothetical protein QL285_045965 [Trifolium repens]